MTDRIVRVLSGGRLVARGVVINGRSIEIDLTGAEKLNFDIDWSEWLNGRTISSAANETDGPDVTQQIAGSVVTLTISGEGGTIQHRITTNTGKIKELLITVSGSGVIVDPPVPDGSAPTFDASYFISVTTGQVASFDLQDAIADADGDYVGVLLTADPAGGTFSLDVDADGVSVGTGTYDPLTAYDALAPGETADDAATISVYDAAGHYLTGVSVPIVITGADAVDTEPPVIAASAIGVLAGENVTGDFATDTTDPEDDLVGFYVGTPPTRGSLVLDADANGVLLGTYTYYTGDDFAALSAGATDTETFTIYAYDADGNVSAETTYTVTITGATPPQAAPVIADYSGSVDRDATLSITLPTPSDTDGDAGTTGALIVTSVVKGTLTTATTVTGWSYDPAGAYDDLYSGDSAIETFTYTWTDTAGNVSNVATATITINGVGSAPSEPVYPYASFLPPAELPQMMAFMNLPMAAANMATIESAGTGLWSAASTWTPARVPVAGDNIKINYGHTVTYDEAKAASVSGNKAYNFIENHGKLVMDPAKSTRLRCDTYWGAYGSEFEARLSLPFDCEMSFVANGAFNVTTDPHKLGKGFINHGETDISGVAVDAVACSATYPLAGDTSLTLAASPTNWRVGDTIIIPGQAFSKKQPPPVTFEDEIRTITGISGNVVSWNGGLAYDHDEIDRFLGEVTPSHDYGDSMGTGGKAPVLMIQNMSSNITFKSEGGAALATEQRPHMMLMMMDDGAQINVTNCAIWDMGRTNKRVRAFTVAEAGTVTATTNLKGRYPLHLHWCAFHPDDWTVDATPATIRGLKIFRSPGWGLTQHRGTANISYCQTHDMFGHLVWETGDEISNTVDNNVTSLHRARRASGGGFTGNVLITKAAVFVDNHDNFATGQSIGASSRAINLTNHYAYSSEGDAIVWMSRGPYATDTNGKGLHKINSNNLEDPDAHAYLLRLGTDNPRIRGFRHVQVQGCTGAGIHVIKSGPPMEHDLRTFMDDYIALNCYVGAEFQYTGHYSQRRWLMLGPNQYSTGGRTGIIQFNSALDMAFDRINMGGYPTGITQEHFIAGSSGNRPQPNAGAFQYVFDNLKFGSQVVSGFPAVTNPMPDLTLTRAGQDGMSGTEDLIYNTTIGATTYGNVPNSAGTKTISMQMYVVGGSTPQTVWQWATRNYELRGTVTDTYGTRNVPSPYGNSGAIIQPNKSCDIIRLGVNEMSAILAAKGYWQDGSGDDYTEYNPPFTIRDKNSPDTTTVRIYFDTAVPGTNGVTPVAFFGNQVFTDNGFKA